MSEVFDDGNAIHSVAAYQAWSAPQNLLDFAERIWWQHGDPLHPAPQLLLPHAEPSLCLMQSGETARLVVCGPARSPRLSALHPGQRLLGITLRPEAATALCGVHPEDCVDEMVAPQRSMSEYFRPHIEDWSFQSSPLALAGLVSVLGDYIRQLDLPGQADLEHIAAYRIRKTTGRIALGRLADDLDISPRQLRRRFIDRLGVSPKRYAREHRLAAAIGEADAFVKPDWAAIAAGVGYCDQAHLIADTRDLTGLTPVILHQRRHGMTETSNTARRS